MDPLFGGRARGKADLNPAEPGLEGDIEIRRRTDDGKDEQRFKMEAEHLAPRRVVTFQIADPDTPGAWVTLATIAADGEGEAEISTQDGLAIPLGVADVSELIGRAVRIIDGDAVLLTGTVPMLVAD